MCLFCIILWISVCLPFYYMMSAVYIACFVFSSDVFNLYHSIVNLSLPTFVPANPCAAFLSTTFKSTNQHAPFLFRSLSVQPIILHVTDTPKVMWLYRSRFSLAANHSTMLSVSTIWVLIMCTSSLDKNQAGNCSTWLNLILIVNITFSIVEGLHSILLVILEKLGVFWIKCDFTITMSWSRLERN